MNPPLVTPFFLTLGVSFLIGIGLREYYEGEGKLDTFGTVRTFVFIGMLGFVLYQLPDIGHVAFLAGLVALALFLLIYYADRVRQRKTLGLIGVMIAQLTYATGPIALHQPNWYLVLLAITILIVLHSKGRIRQFTDRLETGEVVTACKFLAIVAVVLPLIPAVPDTDSWLGLVFSVLPVTPRQVWLAVVITTAISYLGYVLQTYVIPRRGLVLTGILGGVYSSTVAVVVLAKKSKSDPASGRHASMAILLAVGMMYLRLLALVTIFRPRSAVVVAPALLTFAGLAAAYALWLRRSWAPAPVAPATNGTTGVLESDLRRNPLELNAALLFALMFVVISFATKYVLDYFASMGLWALSFVVGFSDITPFVVSLLQGSFDLGDHQILQAIIIASASNNLLKTAYTYALGLRATANRAAPGMIGLAVLSLFYALVVL